MSSAQVPSTAQADASWHEAVIRAFKANDVRIVVYVPDNVLRPLIEAVHADDYFTVFAVAREEEGIGIVSGAAMAGSRGIVLMQTSGFATLANRHVKALRMVVDQIDDAANFACADPDGSK